MPDSLEPREYRDLVRHALEEDIGPGDVTTAAIVPPGLRARAGLVAKGDCVLAGLAIVRETFAQVDPAVTIDFRQKDGDRCAPGTLVAVLEGPAASMLRAERTALNFLQHLSGIATITRRFVDAAGGRLTILDTRKTIPTLRALAKYAVRCGGGENHRTGLYDGVLIKDNHVRAAGGVAEAVQRVREHGPDWPIEVEAQSAAEVDAAVRARVDTVMLDNLDDEQMRQAIRRIAGRARVELSGGVTLERMPALRELGADCVSVGAITHSAPAADISLEVEIERERTAEV
jgi:nicotinate-nucleotide pyrophosphorylase (carboxylating)